MDTFSTKVTGQISLYDYFSNTAKIGPADNKNVGIEIPFQKLKDYIGKMLIYASGSGDKTDYRVIKLTDYYDESDQYFSYTENGVTEYISEYVMQLSSEEKKKKMKPVFVCDRIAYSDDRRTEKTNSWLSEVF